MSSALLSPSSGGRSARASKRQRKSAPADDEDAAGSGTAQDDGLTDYERQRMQLMLSNRQRMEELQLPGLVDSLKQYSAKPAPVRGLQPKKSKAAARSVPQRQSARLRGVGADPDLGAGVKSETLGGKVELFNEAAADAFRAQAKRGRHPQGPLPFLGDAAGAASSEGVEEGRGDEGGKGAGSAEEGGADEGRKGAESDEEAVLTLLRRLASAASDTAGRSSGKGAERGPSRAEAPRLKLVEGDVAKVTRDGTTGIVAHPCSAYGLLLATADKQGNVGFWSTGRHGSVAPCGQQGADKQAGKSMRGGQQRKGQQADAEGEESAVVAGEEVDRFCSMKVHDQYISSICWVAGGGAPHVLATSSYDGSVRVLDVNAGSYELLQGLPQDIEISSMSCADASTFYVGDNEGQILRLDRRAPSSSTTTQVHSRRLNTIEFHADGVTMCSASSDASIKLWDLRKWGEGAKPTDTMQHLKSCHAAYFCPDGSQRILSTSYDDTLRVWQPSPGTAKAQGAKQGSGTAAHWHDEVTIRHNNNTGRWLIPFRAIWGPSADWVACCSMKKGIDILCPRSGQSLAALHSDCMTAIPSRLCVQAELGVLAAATGSGRVHLWKVPA